MTKRLGILVLWFALAWPAATQILPIGGRAQVPDITAWIDGNPRAGDTAVLHLEYVYPDELHQILQPEFFTVTTENTDVTLGEVTYPPGDEKDGQIWYYDRTEITLPVTFSKQFAEADITLVAGYQLCNDEGVCFLPGTVDVSLDTSGIAPAGFSWAGLATLGRFLLLAFLGGLILNVMPCVLPVLSLKAMHLVNQSQGDRREILAGSLLYSAGIVVSMWVLAGFVIALQLLGNHIGWGFQFQNPGFVLGLSAVIFVFGLSMLDVFVIEIPGLTLAASASGRAGHAGSFLTGVFAVILATPCTAPFLGTALGFAFSQPPVTILGMFTAIGLGLALPFLLLGFWPAVVQRLPKPGKWMQIFKEFMGFLLLGTVLWLLSVLFYQIGVDRIFGIALFFLALALGAWGYGTWGGPGRSRKAKIWSLSAGALLVLGAGLAFVNLTPVEATKSGGTASIDLPLDAAPFTEEAFQAARANDSPVLVMFGAKWCVTCQTNEKTVFSADSVRAAAEEIGLSVLYGDFTNGDETIARWIARYGKGGVPVYALYAPGADQPVLLPEILTRGIVLDAFESVAR